MLITYIESAIYEVKKLSSVTSKYKQVYGLIIFADPPYLTSLNSESNRYYFLVLTSTMAASSVMQYFSYV